MDSLLHKSEFHVIYNICTFGFFLLIVIVKNRISTSVCGIELNFKSEKEYIDMQKKVDAKLFYQNNK